LVALLGLWVALFLAAPILIVFKISLAETRLARPPYTPLLVESADGWSFAGTLANYVTLMTDAIYARALARSVWLAGISTALALVLALPMAYAVARASSTLRRALLAAILLPFWTSFLIRVYAWIAILKDEGLLNAALLGLGLIGAPLAILNTDAAVVIGIVYAYLPFLILPLYVAFARIAPSMAEAAADLGATPTRTFWTVTLPMAAPGVVAGSLLVFIPAVGEAVIPDLLGGAETLMIGKSLWTEFFQSRDWPLASAIAVLLLALLVGPTAWLEGRDARRREAGRA
jgi:putrescine transport system permease protein